jgi:hypothetical protein
MNFNISELNSEIKKIKSLFSKEKTFDEGKQAFLALHSQFYSSKMTGG